MTLLQGIFTKNKATLKMKKIITVLFVVSCLAHSILCYADNTSTIKDQEQHKGGGGAAPSVVLNSFLSQSSQANNFAESSYYVVQVFDSFGTLKETFIVYIHSHLDFIILIDTFTNHDEIVVTTIIENPLFFLH